MAKQIHYRVFSSLLVFLLQYSNFWSEAKTIGIENTNGSEALEVVAQHKNQCLITENDVKVWKEVNTTWVFLDDPCTVHKCEAIDDGYARENFFQLDCKQLNCDIDSELLKNDNNTCCGNCVRTKCSYKNEFYEFDQEWFDNDDCDLYKCTKLLDGTPVVNSTKKKCPPLPSNCDPKDIYVENCCQYCQNNEYQMARSINQEDMPTDDFYSNHSCVRDCKIDGTPQICYYKFFVEWYQTLSKACFACPQNLEDCNRQHCIVADGMSRSVTVVNRMMPGPTIEVCENDLIVVDVYNQLLGESTTIHWHGLHQKSTPYDDGVGHISQCPISPHSQFRYSFKADNSGTHFWHSHTGMQRGDGVFGALIVKQPKSLDPHGQLYDFDLPEHKIILQDWTHDIGVSVFANHHHAKGGNKPHNILVNGHGRYFKILKDNAKLSAKSLSKDQFESNNIVTKDQPAVELNVDLDNMMKNNESKNFDGTKERIEFNSSIADDNFTIDALFYNLTTSVTEETPKINQRSKRNTDNNFMAQIPLQVYTVKNGFRYRFRLINAGFLNCPIAISIDNHNLVAINSDGYDFQQVTVGALVSYAGERFDFVVNANQSIGNYWIRFKGLMDCGEAFNSAFQVAILRYEGAPATEPNADVKYSFKAPGVELNSLNVGPGHPDMRTIAEVKALDVYDNVLGLDRDALKLKPDFKFFIYYDFYAKDNPNFYHNYYTINSTFGPNTLYTPQLNHISLKFPSGALLPLRDQIDDSMFCNETTLKNQGIDCRKEFCHCHHVLQVPLNAIVEFIIVDEGFTFNANHPFHLHGNAFRVVGLEKLGQNVTIEMVKKLDEYNLLKRNLDQPPVKDTVTVPDGGYTIVRFKAYNPGFWLLHCHIEFHAEIGMALILKVGQNKEMVPVPKNFPTCQDYLPEFNSTENDNEHSFMTTESSLPSKTTTMRNKSNTLLLKEKHFLSFVLLLIYFKI